MAVSSKRFSSPLLLFLTHRGSQALVFIPSKFLEKFLTILCLADEHHSFLLLNFHSNEISHFIQINHLKGLLHILLELGNKFKITSCNQQVINIQRDNNKINLNTFDAEGSFIETFSKPQLHQILINSAILGPRCLLQAVKSLLKQIHIIFFPFHKKSLRLFYIDIFLKKTIQKCKLYI